MTPKKVARPKMVSGVQVIPKIGHRPSVLTRALMDRIAGTVRIGNFPEVAARANGIHRDTYYNWMKYGRSNVPGPDGADCTYVDFVDAIEKAKAEAEVGLAAVLRNAAAGVTVIHHNRANCPLLQGLARVCECPRETMPGNPFIAARMLESLGKERWLRTTRLEVDQDAAGPDPETALTARDRLLGKVDAIARGLAAAQEVKP